MSTQQLGLMDQFAVDAGESGRIIALVTVSDLDLTIEEVNNLTVDDRMYLGDLFRAYFNEEWEDALRFTVAAWRDDQFEGAYEDVSNDDEGEGD